MKKYDYKLFRDDLLKEACDLNDRKNNDYSKENEDFLAHFKESGKSFNIDPKRVIGIYLKKQTDAVQTFIKTNGASESEPIRERIKDVINYSIMLLALSEEEDKSFIEDEITGKV